VSLDEAITLRKKSLAEVEEYLTSKNWSLVLAEDPTEDDMGMANFAFEKSAYDDKAQAFITFYYSARSGRTRLDVQVHKKEIYTSYINRIKVLGCKLIKSKIEDNKIIKVYRGKTTTIEISIATQKDSFDSTKTSYHFFITENEDSINDEYNIEE
jgi:hypothetical protein